MSADLIIRNGVLVDGSELPAYQGDIAIKDGLILAVSTRAAN
jgi:N-acyl-D-aspartate/D-glutamate deacylase